jgi:hypothetical protein
MFALLFFRHIAPHPPAPFVLLFESSALARQASGGGSRCACISLVINKRMLPCSEDVSSQRVKIRSSPLTRARRCEISNDLQAFTMGGGRGARAGISNDLQAAGGPRERPASTIPGRPLRIEYTSSLCKSNQCSHGHGQLSSFPTVGRESYFASLWRSVFI